MDFCYFTYEICQCFQNRAYSVSSVTPDVAHSAGEGSVVRVAMTMLLFPSPSPTGLKCLHLTMEFI